MCWRTVRQMSYVAKDGVTASGYSAEYTREIRAVSYSPVSDEVIPSNAKDTSYSNYSGTGRQKVLLTLVRASGEALYFRSKLITRTWPCCAA